MMHYHVTFRGKGTDPEVTRLICLDGEAMWEAMGLRHEAELGRYPMRGALQICWEQCDEQDCVTADGEE